MLILAKYIVWVGLSHLLNLTKIKHLEISSIKVFEISNHTCYLVFSQNSGMNEKYLKCLFPPNYPVRYSEQVINTLRKVGFYILLTNMSLINYNCFKLTALKELMNISESSLQCKKFFMNSRPSTKH